jgi:nicotinamidase-related amidase
MNGVVRMKNLQLNLRSQVLERDAEGFARWRVVTEPRQVAPERTALLLCDVWDAHWSRGATARVNGMVGRMNEVVRSARARGVTIVHAPSDTMAFYEGGGRPADTLARERVRSAPQVEPPPPLERPDPPLPIDDSDSGSDTGETPWFKAWSRQHPAIEIDHDRDGISDNGQEIYSFLRQRGIETLLIMGVHTNMCVLHRSFGIKQMVRWGLDVVLLRDLTDTMYNPAMRPYVDHDEGTRLVVEFIEKFWCPTIASGDLLAG